MKTTMRTLVVSALTIVWILSLASLTHAQDLSRYRNFSFGMTLADISTQIGSKPGDVERDSRASGADSGIDVVAAAALWLFASGGAGRAGSLLFLQWRALQNAGHL